MSNKRVLKGRVVSGAKKAAFFTQLDWVLEQCSEKLGFKPFPGTLNIEILPESFLGVESIQKEKVIELIPPDQIHSAFCTAQVLPVSIEGIVAAMIIPEEKVRMHGKNIIEVIAPVSLKDALNIKDGDTVTLTLKDHKDSRGQGFEDSSDPPQNRRIKIIFKPNRKILVDAVILDLDGTIIDSIGIYFKIVNAVLERLGLPRVSTADLMDATENGEFDWNMILPEEIKENKEEVIKNAWKIAEEIYPKMFFEKVNLIPGAKDVLTRVSKTGIKLAVVTSTPQKNMTYKLKPLIESGISHLMEEIITADDTSRKKPAADPLIECSKRLGIAAGKSVYVGDMRLDIKAGKSAGTKTIGVLTGFADFESLKTEEPDAIINSIAELPDVIFM